MSIAFRRILAAAGVTLCLAVPARSQEAANAPPITVFSDVLGRGEYATVLLAGRTAYRLEVVPGTAAVAIRPQNLGLGLPQITSAMENPVEAMGGASWLVVPAETAPHRVEVTAASVPVRIRIVRDPREQAILEGRARSAWYMLAFGGRYVAMSGDFPMAPGDTAADASGFEVCLGIVEGLVPFARRLHGCAVTYAKLTLATGGDLVLAGLAPRYRLAGGQEVALDAVLNISVAGTLTMPLGSSGEERATVQMLAVGLNFRFRPAPPIELEVEPGYAWVERDAYGLVSGGVGGVSQNPAATTTMPRISAGVRLRF